MHRVAGIRRQQTWNQVRTAATEREEARYMLTFYCRRIRAGMAEEAGRQLERE